MAQESSVTPIINLILTVVIALTFVGTAIYFGFTLSALKDEVNRLSEDFAELSGNCSCIETNLTDNESELVIDQTLANAIPFRLQLKGDRNGILQGNINYSSLVLQEPYELREKIWKDYTTRLSNFRMKLDYK